MERKNTQTAAITGAAGNLGGILAQSMACDNVIITIGKVSYYGDTSRMKKDLLPGLKYPTFQDGIKTL